MGERMTKRQAIQARNAPRPGEIQFKTWIANEAARLGITEKAFAQRYYRGRVPKPKIRRINHTVVWVNVKNGNASSSATGR